MSTVLVSAARAGEFRRGRMLEKYLFLGFNDDPPYELLNVDEAFSNCEVVENAAAVKYVWYKRDVKINLLPHLSPILLQ
jgi:hypothetical protein